MPYARSPKIEIKQDDISEFGLKFRLSDTDVSVANAIRRIMIAEVPTMAINLVTVLENTSALADEYIVHRLGLIPLHSENVNDFEFAHDCTCDDYCPNCSVSLQLRVQAAQETGQVRVVTSKDIVITNDVNDQQCQKVRPVHDSGNVKPRPKELLHRDGSDEDGIVIARLSSGQRIDMTAIARKGIAKDHAKHSPMCTVAYRIIPPAVELELERINSLFSLAAKKDLVEASMGLVSLDETTEAIKYETPFLEGRIAITPDTQRKVGQLAIAAGAKPYEVVRNNPQPKCFDFTAETTGAMSPLQALQMALNILAHKIDTVMSHVRET